MIPHSRRNVFACLLHDASSLGPNLFEVFFNVCVNQYWCLSFFSLVYSLLSPAVMPRFTEQVESAVEALSANPSQPVDENEFIDASRLVYDGIRDIRKAVLMIRVSCIIFLISLVQQTAFFFFLNLELSHFCFSSYGLREMSCCIFFPVLKLQCQNVGCFTSG